MSLAARLTAIERTSAAQRAAQEAAQKIRETEETYAKLVEWLEAEAAEPAPFYVLDTALPSGRGYLSLYLALRRHADVLVPRFLEQGVRVSIEEKRDDGYVCFEWDRK
jgi:hypothetical protein